jgi:hypothetical protein
MSTLVDVLDAVRCGVPGPRVASYLGIDDGLAEVALDHWVRLGILTRAGDLHLGCSACQSSGGRTVDDRAPQAPPCAGCPFSR